MLWLHFAGWFQCRLATDPDPSDEPRGVSGYAHAAAGEPDLDRVVRLQPAGAVQRSHTPPVGVSVRAVAVNGRPVDGHPLVGARVDLLDSPTFEGRNGIVAEAGSEPIVPFVLEVARDGVRLERRHDDDERFPFRELHASGIQPGLSAVADATGIYDLAETWRERSALVRRDLEASTDTVERAALRKRLSVMANPGLARFFGVRMLYAFSLRGRAVVEDPDDRLPERVDPQQPWPVDFWLGGWDTDAFQGFMRGAVGLPLRGAGEREPVIERLGDPDAALRA
ncbi:MAG TPA: hypothetical protein VGW75_00660 [Solirubrobacteraceae bacterium]|jgi:hypothetical protein|nr:hypothetical protein [Solirubrobacteraceae bacterium]